MPNQHEIQLSIPPSVSISPGWFVSRDELLAACQTISVKDQESFTLAEVGLKRITATAKQIEEQRKEITKPIDDAKKKVMAVVEIAVEPLETQKSRLKKEMAAFVAKLEAERAQAERDRMAEEAARVEAADADPFGFGIDAMAIAPVVQPPQLQRIASTVKKVWRFEIENPSLVPREFCSPDERKLREYVQREKESAAIAGVRTWEETTVQSR